MAVSSDASCPETGRAAADPAGGHDEADLHDDRSPERSSQPSGCAGVVGADGDAKAEGADRIGGVGAFGGGDRSVRAIHVLIVSILALLVGVVVLRPWPLDVPVIYRADVFQHLALTQASDVSGAPAVSSDLGAPASVDWSAFPTGAERLQVAVLHVLDVATGDVVIAMNLYLLLGLVLSAAVTFAVLRWLRLAPVIAGGAALVIALGPAWSEAVFAGHLFLFGMWPVSLGLFLTFWCLDRTGRRPWPSRGAVMIAACAAVAVALSSSYYATFSVIVIVSTGVLAVLRRRDIRRLIAPAVVTALIVVVAGASLAPQLLARRGAPTATAVERTVDDARRYGLDPLDLLMPRAGHPVPGFSAVGAAIDRGVQAERVSSPFGLAALVGAVWVGAVFIRHWRRPRDHVDATAVRLAGVMAVGLAFAVAGALGFVLAELGFTQIRAWTRMTVFVYLAAIVGLATLGQRALSASSLPRRTVTCVVVAVSAVAMLDQGVYLPSHELAAKASDADAELVADMSSRLGSGAAVFELPVVSFPDDVGSGRLLAPSLLSSGLRFSGGFFRGGNSDWQLSWCRQPTAQLIAAVTSAGFDALMLQNDHHMLEHASASRAELDLLLGPASGTSADGTWSWWNLRPHRRSLDAANGVGSVHRAGAIATRPIGVSYRGTTSYRLAGRTFDGDGAVVLRRLDEDRSGVTVQFDVVAAPGSSVSVRGEEVALDENGHATVRLEVSPVGASTSIPVREQFGGAVTVSDLSVIDTRAFADPVLDATSSGQSGAFGCM